MTTKKRKTTPTKAEALRELVKGTEWLVSAMGLRLAPTGRGIDHEHLSRLGVLVPPPHKLHNCSACRLRRVLSAARRAATP